MTTKQNPNEIRSQVEKAYGKAINSSKRNAECCVSKALSSILPSFIGYQSKQLGALRSKEEVTSFGCGNPLAFSEVKGGDVVLDLGSGAGLDLIIAANKVGPTGRVIGVDMTDEMIATAQGNLEKEGLTNVEVKKGIIEDLPIESNSVDWVISNCVINLSPEKEKVFSEIYRVLKPGGRMLVSDIVADDLPNWIKDSEHLYSSCISGAISEKKYIAKLKNQGMVHIDVVEKKTYGENELRNLIGCGINDGNYSDAELEKAKETLANRIHSIRVSGQK